MTLHDPFAGPDREAAPPSRLSRLRKLRHRPRRTGRPAAPAPARDRDQRRLGLMDRKLAAETPRLASMFAMFELLARDEGPVSAERLPAAARPPRPRRRYLVVLLALASVAAVCYTLSTQLHAVRSCPSTAAATATAQLPPVRTASCPAYATTNK